MTALPLLSVTLVTPPNEAEIVDVPGPTMVAKPVLLIVATVGTEDDHVAVVVRFCVVPSEKCPVAVNCCVPPTVSEGFAGVTVIDTSVAEPTVSVVLESVAAVNVASPRKK